MNNGTEQFIIEDAIEAINSGDYQKILAEQNTLRAICHQQGESWLLFVINEIVPVLNQRQAESNTCKYCNTPFNNNYGLLAHLGKKHAEMKSEWSTVGRI